MSEAIQISKQKSAVRSVELPNIFTKLFGDIEFNRYGLIAVIILAVVCTASVAVGLGSMTNPVEIAFLIFPCVFTLSFILAVAPMKLIMYTATISLLISISLIIINVV